MARRLLIPFVFGAIASSAAAQTIRGSLTVDRRLDTSCFANPAQHQAGNDVIGNVPGRSVFNTDFSASKRTAVGRATAEVRVDVFNLFNRAHFANPATTFGNSTFGNSTFGTISATRLTPREGQLGFRLLF